MSGRKTKRQQTAEDLERLRQKRLANLTNKGKGRVKGIPNKATVETKQFFGRILSDPVYQENLIQRMRNGEVNAAVETMAWYYWGGKPQERLEIGADKSLADLVNASARLTAEDIRSLMAMVTRPLLPKP